MPVNFLPERETITEPTLPALQSSLGVMGRAS
jgi:hypothetical protein